MLSNLHQFLYTSVNLYIHLMLTVTLNSRYYSNFTDEETLVYLTNNMHNIIWILIGGARIQLYQCSSSILHWTEDKEGRGWLNPCFVNSDRSYESFGILSTSNTFDFRIIFEKKKRKNLWLSTLPFIITFLLQPFLLFW